MKFFYWGRVNCHIQLIKVNSRAGSDSGEGSRLHLRMEAQPADRNGGTWRPHWSQPTGTSAGSWCQPALSAHLCLGSVRLPSARPPAPAGQPGSAPARGLRGQPALSFQGLGSARDGGRSLAGRRLWRFWCRNDRALRGQLTPDTPLSQPEVTGCGCLPVGAEQRPCPETAETGSRATVVNVSSWKAVRVSEGTGAERDLLRHEIPALPL